LRSSGSAQCPTEPAVVVAALDWSDYHSIVYFEIRRTMEIR
jgi:hypothetical protein